MTKEVTKDDSSPQALVTKVTEEEEEAEDCDEVSLEAFGFPEDVYRRWASTDDVERSEGFGSFLPDVAAGDAMNSAHIMILTGMCLYKEFYSTMIQHQVYHHMLEYLKDNMEQNIACNTSHFLCIVFWT
jgi:hypothetical protein